MSKIRASITYFDLEAFGFYRIRKGNKYEHVNGDMEGVLKSLLQWLSGKKVGNTVPWDDDSYSRRTNVYCRSYTIDNESGDVVLVLWKDVGDRSGNVHGAFASSDVGKDTSDGLVSGSDVNGEDVIWGQPCYYWFIPSKNKIASIKFSSSISDTDAVKKYIKSFVDYRGNFPNKRKSERTINHSVSGRPINITTFTFDYLDKNKKKYSASFRCITKLYRKPSNTLDYAALAEEVSHLVYRDTISAKVQDSRPKWLKMVDALGPAFGSTRPANSEKRAVEVIIEAKPTPSELKKLIERYSEEHDESSDWNNVGLKRGGRSSSTLWLDEFVLRDELWVPQTEDEVYTAEKLMSAIISQRERLVSELSLSSDDPEINQSSETNEENDSQNKPYGDLGDDTAKLERA